MSTTPKNGDKIMSAHGLAHVSYYLSPGWKPDPSDVRFAVARPWHATGQGRARGSFASLREAIEALRDEGYSFPNY